MSGTFRYKVPDVYPTRQENRVNKYVVAGMISLALGDTAQSAAEEYPAAKSDKPKSPWYVGAGIGQTYASIPEQTIASINSVLSTANGATFSVMDKKKHSGLGKFLVGYNFNRNFSVEGGYASLGNTSVDMDFRNGLNSVGTFSMNYKMSATFIDAVGVLPVTNNWSLIGRVGVNYGKTTVNSSGAPTSILISKNDRSASTVREKFGAGVDYNLNPAFTVRAEWERYKMPDPLSNALFSADSATLSLLYHF